VSARTDEYLRMLEDCEQRESRLTDWEREFVDSLRQRLDRGHGLTPKQIECIDKIWERATARG
jgi:phosphoserine phosphatase